MVELHKFIKELEAEIATLEEFTEKADIDRGMGGHPDRCTWLHDELKGMKRALKLAKKRVPVRICGGGFGGEWIPQEGDK